jgi:hypothetical protein
MVGNVVSALLGAALSPPFWVLVLLALGSYSLAWCALVLLFVRRQPRPGVDR